MHSRRQARTRRVNKQKGKKLKGLTKQEAVERSKKGWLTKHRKYRYSKAEEEPRGFGHTPGSADDETYVRSKMSGRERRKEAASERETTFAEGSTGHKVTEDEMFAEAQRAIESGGLEDEATRRLFSRLSPDQQDQFVAMYIAQAEARKGRGRMADSRVEYTRDSAFQTVRGKGYDQINRDVSHRVPLSQFVKTSEPRAGSKKKAQEGRYDRGRVRDLSPEEARAQFREELTNIPSVRKVLQPIQVGGKPGEVDPGVAALIDQAAGYSALSHYARTPEARAIAVREAEKSHTKLAQIVQQADDRRGVARETQQVQQRLLSGARTQKFHHGQPVSQSEYNRLLETTKTNIDPSGRKLKEPITLKDALERAALQDERIHRQQEEVKAGPREAEFTGTQDRLKRDLLAKHGLEERPFFSVDPYTRWGVRDPRGPGMARGDHPRDQSVLRDIYNLPKYQGTAGRARFIRDQAINKVNAFRKGTGQYSFQHDPGSLEKLKQVTPEEADLIIGPNKAFKYKLRKRDQPGVFEEKTIPYHDRTTKFNRGSYDFKTGEPKEGSFDEVAAITSIRAQEPGLDVKLGERDPRRRPPLEKGVHKEEFVVLPGISERSSKYINRKGVDLSHPDDFKKVKITYIPEHEAVLRRGESDVLAVAGPKRRAELKLEEGSLAQKMLTGPGKAKAERELRDESAYRGHMTYRRLDANMKDPLFREALGREVRASRFGDPYAKVEDGVDTKKESDKLIKDLGAAGAAATAYGIRRKLKREGVPRAENKAWAAFRNSSQLKPLMDKFRAPETIHDIKKGAGEPLAKWAANKVYSFRHPLSSPTGTGAGIEYQGWRFREHGIREHIYQARQLEKRTKELQRTAKIRDFFDKHAYSQNPLMKRIVKRRDNLLRLQEYKNFTGNLQEEITHLDRVRVESSSPHVKREAAKRLAQLSGLRAEDMKRANRGKDWTGEVLPVAFEKASRNLPGGKPALIAGAAVASTIGASYLYHRHQESKKAPEDRIAFYNKALPPSFSTPRLPKFRTTSKFTVGESPLTKEIGLANRTIPTQIGVKMQRRRIRLRPGDRGYPKNASIVGRPEVRIGKAKGSVVKATGFTREQPSKRQYQVGTHQLKIKGKKVPAFIEIGKREVTGPTQRNPRRLTPEERDLIARTFANTSEASHVRMFYTGDSRMQDLFDQYTRDAGLGSHQREYVAHSAQQERLSGRRGRSARADRLRWASRMSGPEDLNLGKTDTGVERAPTSRYYRRRQVEKPKRSSRMPVGWIFGD